MAAANALQTISMRSGAKSVMRSVHKEGRIDSTLSSVSAHGCGIPSSASSATSGECAAWCVSREPEHTVQDGDGFVASDDQVGAAPTGGVLIPPDLAAAHQGS